MIQWQIQIQTNIYIIQIIVQYLVHFVKIQKLITEKINKVIQTASKMHRISRKDDFCEWYSRMYKGVAIGSEVPWAKKC